jgi:hypothetical protein
MPADLIGKLYTFRTSNLDEHAAFTGGSVHLPSSRRVLRSLRRLEIQRVE